MYTNWDKPLRPGYDRAGLLNLSTNTLLHPNLTELQKKFIKDLPTFSDYVSYDELRTNLANFYNLEFWQTGFVAGSDYLISVLLLLVKDLKLNSIILSRPYYYNYVNYADVHHLCVQYLNQNELFSEETLQKLTNTQPSVIFLTSPCPLSGEIIPQDKLAWWLEKVNAMGHFVVLDQAYAGFGSELYVSLVKKFPAFFLFQTYSKTYGAAGIRFCHYFGPQILIRRLKEYGIENTLSLYAMLYAQYVHNNLLAFQIIQNDIIHWRMQTYQYLNQYQHHLKLCKSYGNFVSVITAQDKQNKFIEKARKNGIFLKNHQDENNAYLRITLTDPENFSPVLTTFSEIFHA